MKKMNRPAALIIKLLHAVLCTSQINAFTWAESS